jgi:hypothetical protein
MHSVQYGTSAVHPSETAGDPDRDTEAAHVTCFLSTALEMSDLIPLKIYSTNYGVGKYSDNEIIPLDASPSKPQLGMHCQPLG